MQRHRNGGSGAQDIDHDYVLVGSELLLSHFIRCEEEIDRSPGRGIVVQRDSMRSLERLVEIVLKWWSRHRSRITIDIEWVLNLFLIRCASCETGSRRG